MGEAFRILFCGLPDECRAISALAQQAGDQFALTLHGMRQSPLDIIEQAEQANAPIETAIVSSAWLQTEEALLLRPLLEADRDMMVIVQTSPAYPLASPPRSDRVMVMPKADASALQLAAMLVKSRRAIEAYAKAESQFHSSQRAYKLVSHEFQRQNRRLQEQEESLRVQKELFETALNNMSQGLCMFDADGKLVVCNGRYLEMYNIPAEVASPGRPLFDMVSYRKEHGEFSGEPKAYCDELLAVVRNGEANSQVHTANGRTVLISNQPMASGGWVATHEDITERTKAEEQIRYLARHDSLTGLANRAAFQEEMEQALKRVRRGQQLAVLCVDLDYFKNVNDTLGHLIGDKLLIAATARLKETVREVDLIARLGGDEFAVLQFGPGEPGNSSAFAQRLINGLNEPYDIDGHHVVISASLGIAVAPNDGTSAEQLMRNADMALYRAKSEGRATFRFFEPEMDANLQARRTLELDLRKALENGEFELYYQPQVNVATEALSGCEALLRWNHPTRGLVSPGEFVPLAEEIGLIVPIGEWVLQQACAEAVKWPASVMVAVNLSAAQFRSRTLVQTVLDALKQSGLDPRRLELEITESVLLHDNEGTLATLHELRSHGIRISMDDFGTGYSSLSYLRSFPFDKIKIDRSFIKDLAHQNDCSAIIKAVAGLGRGLGIVTTAEGVETAEQLDHIRAEGCTEVQGYLFSAPQPAARIRELVACSSTGAAVAA